MARRGRSSADLHGAAYAYVTPCDGNSSFSLIGVVPANNKTFNIFSFVARGCSGVRMASVFLGHHDDHRRRQESDMGLKTVDITLAQAYWLFVKPAVDRTVEMPQDPGVKTCIDFFRIVAPPAMPADLQSLLWVPPAEEGAACPLGQVHSSVRIRGLIAKPHFNGLTGLVEGEVAETGRIRVSLHFPSAANGTDALMLKPENLEILDWPPVVPEYMQRASSALGVKDGNPCELSPEAKARQEWNGVLCATRMMQGSFSKTVSMLTHIVMFWNIALGDIQFLGIKAQNLEQEASEETLEQNFENLLKCLRNCEEEFRGPEHTIKQVAGAIREKSGRWMLLRLLACADHQRLLSHLTQNKRMERFWAIHRDWTLHTHTSSNGKTSLLPGGGPCWRPERISLIAPMVVCFASHLGTQRALESLPQQVPAHATGTKRSCGWGHFSSHIEDDRLLARGCGAMMLVAHLVIPFSSYQKAGQRSAGEKSKTLHLPFASTFRQMLEWSKDNNDCYSQTARRPDVKTSTGSVTVFDRYFISKDDPDAGVFRRLFCTARVDSIPDCCAMLHSIFLSCLEHKLLAALQNFIYHGQFSLVNTAFVSSLGAADRERFWIELESFAGISLLCDPPSVHEGMPVCDDTAAAVLKWLDIVGPNWSTRAGSSDFAEAVACGLHCVMQASRRYFFAHLRLIQVQGERLPTVWERAVDDPEEAGQMSEREPELEEAAQRSKEPEAVFARLVHVCVRELVKCCNLTERLCSWGTRALVARDIRKHLSFASPPAEAPLARTILYAPPVYFAPEEVAAEGSTEPALVYFVPTDATIELLQQLVAGYSDTLDRGIGLKRNLFDVARVCGETRVKDILGATVERLRVEAPFTAVSLLRAISLTKYVVCDRNRGAEGKAGKGVVKFLHTQCSVCRRTAAHAGVTVLMKCTGCKGPVRYCSRQCQKADWPQHKLVCHRAPGKASK